MSLFSLLLISMLVMVGGCSHTQHNSESHARPKPVTVPAWYLTPPANTKTRLYGTGEGETMEEATRHALSNLLARISVTVSSTYKSRELSHTDVYEYVSKERSYDIETIVKKLPVTNYRTLRSQRLAWNRYITLIAVDRDDFTAPILQNVTLQVEKAETDWNTAEGSGVLRRYKAAKEAKRLYEGLLNETAVLAALDPVYKTLHTNLRKRYLYFTRMEAQTKKRLRFCMKPVTDTQIQPFAKTAITAISRRGFVVLPYSSCSEEALRVRVDPTLAYDRVHGFFIVKGTVDMILENADGNRERSERYEVKGVSSQSLEAAILKAAASLKSAFDKKFLIP